MARILDKIVISNYQPKQNNVVWIDSSDGNKIKIISNSGWQSVDGSNSYNRDSGYSVTKSH